MSRRFGGGSLPPIPPAAQERIRHEDAFIPMIGEGGSEDVDHVDVTRTIWRRKWLILAITFVLTSAAGVVVYSLPRHYVAEALIVIGNRDGMTSFVSGNGTATPITKPDAETIQTEIEMLQSPALAAQVVQDLRLQERPEFNPYLPTDADGKGAKSPFHAISNIVAWLKGLAAPFIPSLAEKSTKQDVPAGAQLSQTIGSFLARLHVATKGQSRVVAVEFGAGDPQLAAAAVNSVIDHYIGDQIIGRSQSAEETQRWLGKRTAELRAKVEASEKAVEDFRTSHQLYSGPGGTPISANELAEVTTELARAQALTNSLEGRGRGGGDSRSSTAISSSPLLVTLQTQEADIERQLASNSAELGERNPTILGLRASLREVRRKISSERSKLAGSAAGSIESRLRAARAAEQALKARTAKIKGDVDKNGLAGVTLHTLQREAAANRIVLENFLARSIELAHDGDTAARHLEAQIVSRANVPTSPDKPQRSMLMFIAMACSLVFGIALAILLEKSKRGYRSLEEIEAATQASGLGLVPFIGAARTSPLAVARNAGSSYYASIRSIWTTLSLILDKKSKFILVTSALPQEGKTTLALSLAAMAGHGGHRTVLVDADFWRGCASAALGLGSSSGFAELLDGKIPFEDAIVSDIGAGIDIIRPGTLPRGYDLTMRDKLVRLMNQLASRYEYIIIDAPPVLAISETLFLSAYADATVLAVRWNHTPRGATNLALRRLREARAPIQGIVLTMVDERKHAQSGRAESAYFSKDIMDYYAQSTTQPYGPLSLEGPGSEDSAKPPRGAGVGIRALLRRAGRTAVSEPRIQRYDRPRWALLVVDVQEDFIARSGWSGLRNTALPDFLDNINRVSEAARDHGAIVIYTRQEFHTVGGIFASRLFFHGAGTKGASDNRIHPRINLLSDHQFSKPKWNAFSSAALNNFLRVNKVDHLCLLGLDGVGSIDDTAQSAIERGYRVTFISDCIATPFEHDWRELLTGFEDDRAFAVTSHQFLERLDARDPSERKPETMLETTFANGRRLGASARERSKRAIEGL